MNRFEKIDIPGSTGDMKADIAERIKFGEEEGKKDVVNIMNEAGKPITEQHLSEMLKRIEDAGHEAQVEIQKPLIDWAEAKSDSEKKKAALTFADIAEKYLG